MLFIFGIRATKTAAAPLESCICPYCSKENTLYAKWESNYFHIFFLPFFPTGKTIEITCMHCYKKFRDKFAPPKVAETISRLTVKMNPKRPFWHNCGCLALMLLAAIFMIVGIAGWIWSEKSPKKENPLETKYKADFEKLTANPCQSKTDTISCAVKMYIDMVVIDEMKKDKFEYFSKARGQEVMVIMKIRDMDKIKDAARSDIVDKIRGFLTKAYGFGDEQIYICIEGKWNTLMVYTPSHKDLGGSYANEGYMYDFYKDDNVRVETVSGSLAKHISK